MTTPVIDAVTWLKNEYTEERTFSQTGIQETMSQDTVQSKNWYKSRMTELIGFPLQTGPPSRFDINDYRPARDAGWNNMVNYLHLRVDTDNPDLFGLPDPSIYGTAWTTDVPITRQDLGPLHVKQIELLNDFTRNIREVMYFQRDKHTFENPQSYAAQVWSCFTPATFAEFCVNYRKRMTDNGVTGWKNIECPVLELCGSCIAPRQLDGQTLFLCTGCRRRQYCSTDCQKSDWQRHKTVCPNLGRETGNKNAS